MIKYPNTNKEDFCYDYILNNGSTVKDAEAAWEAIKNIRPAKLNSEYKLDGFLYRDHRGSLCDSMDTVQYFETFHDLEKYIWGLSGMNGAKQVTVEKYSFDKRIMWDSYFVLVNGHVVGFTNKDITEEIKL